MSVQDNILINKLDEFIRKFYKNQLIKGVLYSGSILLGGFLTMVFLEYFGEFNSLIRGVLFFSFLFTSVFIFIKLIAIPLLKLNKIGKIISYNQAAAIIGNHFTNVQDKLLNVLQLQNNQLLSGSDELLMASINQKINDLKPVPFTTAINIAENKKYLKFILPLLIATSVILILWPQVITKSTERIVNYQTYYEQEMPFRFEILNANLQALQSQDFNLELKITGNQLPNEVFVTINGIEYKLEKENNVLFKYTFPNVQSNINFQFNAAGFNSKTYELRVLPKPVIVQFNLELIYPSYLNKPNENIANTGDFQIPQGTKVNWVFNTKNADGLKIRFNDSLANPKKINTTQFHFSRKFLESNAYTIKAINQFVINESDSVNYNINVIPDQFPTIDVNQEADSLNIKNIYFSGQIKDDYGFKALYFNYKKISSDSSGKPTELNGNYPINLIKNQIVQPYFYYLDAGQFNLKPGDKIEYYFEVFDNDGVNGSKSAKTQLMIFKAPTKDEANEKTEKNNSEIKNDLEESIKKANQLQKDVNELSKKINDKKQLGYEEKKKLEDVLKKQQELQNKIEEIKKENEINNKQQNEFSKTDESILEKQKQLEQLFEKVMTPELKKLFDELNKMLEKLDKNEVQQKLEELKLSNKDIEKELDRNLEAFKQLELEKKMMDAIEKIDEIKKQQDDLTKETENKKDDKNQSDKESKEKIDKKELEKKQEDIKKQFENLTKDLKELEQKNKELEEPNAMPKTEQKQNEINKEMSKSSEQLGKNNKKESAKSQKNASDKLQEMKEELENAMSENESKQAEENTEALRQILENLVNLSFAQEELIKKLPKTRIDNPQYVDIPKQQNKLKDDSKIIEDSLLALSKRAPQISAVVNREISAINLNMNKTVQALAERNVGEGTMRMQSTMTSVNNLALLLNEALEQMQNQMKQQQQKGNSGKCKKPGSGKGSKPSDKPSIQSMKKLQEQLNQQMQQLKNAMEKGEKPGEKPGQKPGDKKGQKPGMGQNGNSGLMMPGSSEQFAKMAAQQEALRRQMQEMMDKIKNKGKNPGGNLADLMEQTEKDLVNKQISNETMRRQQDILSKLLESEKAEREREQDEQRKSNEAKNLILSNPNQFLEYKRVKEKEMELLNTVPPSLTPYYKEKVTNYFNRINK
jgi:hypothetical protein